MTRRRYIWSEKEKRLVALDEDWQSETPRRVPVVTDLYMDGLKTFEGVDIGTRKRRKEYMRTRELADASDFKETWAKKAKERAAGGSPEEKRERRTDVERAFYRIFKP